VEKKDADGGGNHAAARRMSGGKLSGYGNGKAEKKELYGRHYRNGKDGSIRLILLNSARTGGNWKTAIGGF